LEKEQQIVFAYLHGSFLQKNNFGDIDIAVYLKEVSEEKIMSYEFRLEEILEKFTSFPVDVRVLNNAPPSFCYSVIKNGIKLLNRDEENCSDFETMTYKIYFDFLPFRRRYLQEAINRK